MLVSNFKINLFLRKGYAPISGLLVVGMYDLTVGANVLGRCLFIYPRNDKPTPGVLQN